MPKVSPIQTNFSSGELSPYMYGAVDIERYRQGLAKCLNFVPVIQGGLTRRPGTKFVQPAKNGSKKCRLIPFEFSTTQAYILEFGENYIRFFTDNAQIESSPGVPLEVATTFSEAQLFEISFTQSADVLYLAHPSHPVRKLSRITATNWVLSEIDFEDGPYLPTNTETTTLTPSATSGSIQITASSIVGINNGEGFKVTDIGRYIRMKQGATWGWMKINSFTSTTVVGADVQGTALAGTAATASWRLSVWSHTTGFPAAICFHEDRLIFGGCSSYPQRVDASNSGDYENMAPSDTAGTVTASHGFGVTLASSDVNAIRWLVSDEKGLVVGTVGGEFVVKSANTEALSATSVTAKRTSTYGTATIQPVHAGKSTLFIQRAGRKLREFSYFYDVDGFRANDLTQISEHITQGGITQLAFQKEPQPIIWGVRGDGLLVGMTYERDMDALRVGWHKHQLGGYSDASGSAAVVESVAVMPSADATRDEVWVSVKRYINGATVRYIEYLTELFEDSIEQEDAYFVDCGLTYSGASATTISGLTHLIGETVSVLADGAVHPDCVVNGSGEITLNEAATKVHIGYGYNSDAQCLRIDAGSADGTSIGKTRRIHGVGFMLHRTLGMKIGQNFTNLTRLTFRTSADNLSQAPALYSGIIYEAVDFDYDTENFICFRQDQPLPMMVLAIFPQMVTNDRG
jgi:hypothetical protein